ncbi:MAG: D-alanyl-D-alanine carboxypeptidase [Chloroflexota bacterium]|nr:D-alanyl-D-alanine carboxypeptidase [Chloroflexota bacterium]
MRVSRRRALLRLAAGAAGISMVGWPRSGEAAPVEPPQAPSTVSARAVAAIDAASGALLFARRAFDELPPASLTKMVTALVALERGAPNGRVRPSRDYDVVPTIIGISFGDELRLEDAIYGLMLNSGNDAALAIAESLADGSVPRFVGWMNELVRRLGLGHTHFANPHGLDHPDHYSSAYDMAVIGRTVMRHPLLSRVVGTERWVVEGPPRWGFRNTNPILGAIPGADGIKTGYEDRAGRCLAATAIRDGRRVVAVVLNSEGTAQDSAAVLDAAFARDDWGSRAPEPAWRAHLASGSVVASLRADLDGASGAPRSAFRAARLAGSGGEGAGP